MPDGERTCDSENCDNRAVVHLTQVADNKSSTQYLCRKCAKKKGIHSESPHGVNVAELLAQLGETKAVESPTVEEPCDFCGMTFKDFRESGRMGCPQCYDSFGDRVRRLLSRIHGASQHGGKVHLPPDPTVAERRQRVEWLRRSLRHAIETEDFERAAVLRDQIRDHEGGGRKGTGSDRKAEGGKAERATPERAGRDREGRRS